ncbi:hypothetical protein Tco_0285991 [Tanacetum coccineum]
MVPNTEKLLEAFIGGLPRSIKGNVTASKPQTLEEAINIAQRLMDQVTKHTPVQVSSDINETELQQARAQITKLQKKQMGNNHKISLACFRITDLEHIINDIQIRHQEDKESLLNAHQEPNVVTEEPKNISQALQDESWVEAMQEELLQFKLQKVWILVDLPSRKKAIGTKPDIMFAVCACARFQVTPKASHLNAVKRIFRLQELASPKQTALSKANGLGKDFPNPFMAGSLPKTIKQSNDPPLSRGYTLGSGEDSLELMELMANCTQIETAVLSTTEEGLQAISATIDGHEKLITEASLRRH